MQLCSSRSRCGTTTYRLIGARSASLLRVAVEALHCNAHSTETWDYGAVWAAARSAFAAWLESEPVDLDADASLYCAMAHVMLLRPQTWPQPLARLAAKLVACIASATAIAPSAESALGTEQRRVLVRLLAQLLAADERDGAALALALAASNAIFLQLADAHEPHAVLSEALCCLPRDAQWPRNTMENAMLELRAPESVLELTLCRLCDWLKRAEVTDGVGVWVLSAIDAFAAHRFVRVLNRAAIRCAPFGTAAHVAAWRCAPRRPDAAACDAVLHVLHQLHGEQHPRPGTQREVLLDILSRMLMGFQCSPAPFLSLVSDLVAHVELAKQTLPSDDPYMGQLVMLATCQMHMHSGHPELYGPLLDAMQGLPQPSESAIVERLKGGAWAPEETADKGAVLDSYRAAARRDGASATQQRSAADYCGLVNIGNTCYWNSILQMLFMVVPFRSAVLQAAAPKATAGSCVAELQRAFAYLLLTRRPSWVPADLIANCSPPWFVVGEQQDCTELLKYLFDQLTPGPQPRGVADAPKTNGAVTDSLVAPFCGQVVIRTRCHRCGQTSERIEDFNDLALPLSQDVHEEGEPLESLLHQYFQPELMSDANQYECEPCMGLTNAERRTVLRRAPAYLVLVIKRFAYDAASKRSVKLMGDARIPLKMQLSPEWTLDAVPSAAVYHLHAIIIHSGDTLNRGHYYCFARDIARDHWLLFNDERVTLVTEDMVLHVMRRFPKDTPYVVVYRMAAPAADAAGLGVAHVPPALMYEVLQDNAAYERELEQQARRRPPVHTVAPAGPYRPDPDRSPDAGSSAGDGMSFANRYIF